MRVRVRARVRARLELVAEFGEQLAHERRGRGLAAQVQLVAAEAEQRARPGPAALLVAHHLHLVHDAHADYVLSANTPLYSLQYEYRATDE